jgi:B12-binding domain/radical SAM domain protein
MQTDLVLIHAPSVYDFREKSIMYGPMSDLVPSSPIFEMYPLGFLTMSNYLLKRGISVRIINLAYLMFEDASFDVVKYLKKIRARCFGIDLHWLPHCQGSLEVAGILKRLHPDKPIVFGGFSSSYFRKELIEFSQVDYIIRGDSAEEPLYQLVRHIKGKTVKLKDIPNLVYKEGGKVFENPMGCISADLDEIDFDYSIMFKMFLRYGNLKSLIPFGGWLKYPITTISIFRGCNMDCSGCGGSKNAFSIFGQRQAPAIRNPKKLVEEIAQIGKYIRSPVFILGDMTQGGREYVEEFFQAAKSLDRQAQMFFEFFEPPEKWFYDMASSTFSKVCYEISPDSHDEKIREKMGKTFTNEELVRSIEYALEKGALRYDLYFMTGLPLQDKRSIMETVGFCKRTYEKLGWDSRFMPFISPMAPFLDPGSRAFENPEEFGYVLKFKTLKEHVKAMTMPSWKYILNYESKAISNDDLVNATYEAAIGLNMLKKQSKAISEQVADANEKRIRKAQSIMDEIDSIMQVDDSRTREEKLKALRDSTYKYSISTVCEKKELEFPKTYRSFRWPQIILKTLRPTERL